MSNGNSPHVPPNSESSVNVPQPTSAELLTRFCTAIRDYEGAPGDANYKNNNPGNCRYNPGGYLPKYGIVKQSPKGFALFQTYALGWEYLEALVREMVLNHSQWNFQDFFSTYAPTSDGNVPSLYAAFVARRMAVDLTANVKTTLNL